MANPKSIVENIDCMIGMARYPDKWFDLAIIDPPYGIGADWEKRTNNRNQKFQRTTYRNEKITNGTYFQELKRVSKNQIIWGYNYYTEFLGSTNYLIVWDKMSANNDVFHYSKCEIAYTTIHIPCNLISLPWDGYRMGSETSISKIHPHQKPVNLYKWLLKNYAKPDDKILDTHLGSGSSRIACYDGGFDFYGWELDKDYYEAQEKRFANHIKQLTMQFTTE